jgi:hypothetical protein
MTTSMDAMMDLMSLAEKKRSLSAPAQTITIMIATEERTAQTQVIGEARLRMMTVAAPLPNAAMIYSKILEEICERLTASATILYKMEYTIQARQSYSGKQMSTAEGNAQQTEAETRTVAIKERTATQPQTASQGSNAKVASALFHLLLKIVLMVFLNQVNLIAKILKILLAPDVNCLLIEEDLATPLTAANHVNPANKIGIAMVTKTAWERLTLIAANAPCQKTISVVAAQSYSK